MIVCKSETELNAMREADRIAAGTGCRPNAAAKPEAFSSSMAAADFLPASAFPSAGYAPAAAPAAGLGRSRTRERFPRFGRTPG